MRILSKIILLAAALVLVPGMAVAGKVSAGVTEFMSQCAVCHGTNGNGHGAYSDMLKTAASDLTILSKNNGGLFPFNMVLRTIDGRDMIKSHGDRDMPIWGNVYNRKAIDYYRDTYDYNSEVFVNGRILSLIHHLQDIQKK